MRNLKALGLAVFCGFALWLATEAAAAQAVAAGGSVEGASGAVANSQAGTANGKAEAAAVTPQQRSKWRPWFRKRNAAVRARALYGWRYGNRWGSGRPWSRLYRRWYSTPRYTARMVRPSEVVRRAKGRVLLAL